MNKKLRTIKLEFFYWRKSIFQYHQFWKYIYNKYILAPKILKLNKVLEKPINQLNLSIHILTCHRDLIMAVWSLASFYLNSTVIGQLYIHNDGSLTNKDKQILKKFFPSSKIIEPFIKTKYYISELKKYQIINDFRNKYSNDLFIKKIIDSFFITSAKFYLLFDTDILWIKNPKLIWQQLESLSSESFMIDGKKSRCYVNFEDGTKLSDKLASLNAGIIFYSKDNFNLNKLSEYLNKFNTKRLRNFYFIEQAGHAYSLENLNKLPSDKYTIQDEISNEVVAKHYTSPRRPLFYIEGIDCIKNKLL